MSNFQPLEVVGRGSETQLQVGENLNYLIGGSMVRVLTTIILWKAVTSLGENKVI